MIIKKTRSTEGLPWPPETNACHRLGAWLALEADGHTGLTLVFTQAELVDLGQKISERDLDRDRRPDWVDPGHTLTQLSMAHAASWFIWSAILNFPFFKSRAGLAAQFVTTPTDEDEDGGPCSLVVTWTEPSSAPQEERAALVRRSG